MIFGWFRRGLGVAVLLVAAGEAAAGADWEYPPARRDPQLDDYHGVKVADPYRWLENLDSAETRAWVAAEAALTSDFLKSLPERAWFRSRLEQLWNYPKYGLPFKEGGRYFFLKNGGLQKHGVLYVQDGADGMPRVLLDPNRWSADGTVALTERAASRDGRWLAYGRSMAGSDWNEFRVRSVDTGLDEPDVLQRIKYSDLSWTRDSRGFFYSRYPAAPGPSRGVFGSLAGQELCYHRLGTAQSNDAVVCALPDHPQWSVNGGVTDDGRYLVVYVGRPDSDDNLVWLADLGDPMHPAVGAPLRRLIDSWDAQYSVLGNAGSRLFLQTNLAAPRGRIVAMDARSPERPRWQTLVPEDADTIESAGLVGGRLVVAAMHDAASRLRVYGEDGAPRGEIPLPGLGWVADFEGHEDDPELFYAYTSFAQPLVIMRYDLGSGQGGVLHAPPLGFRPSDFAVSQEFYRSKDGTRIPMFLVRRGDLVPTPGTPALLYGYGGFDISLQPFFSPQNLLWLEQGGLYAVPNLRGGGEYGEAWHQAGTKARKQNVFDDFIAAADYLVARGYTSRDRLVISGASNGGLLVGAVLNQRPDLCHVAWADVGVMDMLRYQKFTIGYEWASEYGTSDDPADFRALRAYSPLHNIRPGASYPAVLIGTADHDDRVYPAHSFKYAAALQAATADNPDAGPVLLRVETRAGHGDGRPTSKIMDEDADQLAFAFHFLGLHPREQSP